MRRLLLPVVATLAAATVTAQQATPAAGVPAAELRQCSICHGRAEFKKVAEETKTGCIVSRALAAVPMTLDADLVG